MASLKKSRSCLRIHNNLKVSISRLQTGQFFPSPNQLHLEAAEFVLQAEAFGVATAGSISPQQGIVEESISGDDLLWPKRKSNGDR